MFAWYKYLIVNLVFSHLGFKSGNLFLIAPFPDRCLFVPFSDNKSSHQYSNNKKVKLFAVRILSHGYKQLLLPLLSQE